MGENDDNLDSHAVWVDISLVQQHCHNYHGQNEEEAVRLGRKKQQPGRLRWDWVLGRAVVISSGNVNSPDSNTTSDQSRSPFGQQVLRKLPRSSRTEPQNELSSILSLQTKQITIHDVNSEYNHQSFTLPPSESAHEQVLSANSFENGKPPPNLIELTHLHEPALINYLSKRYDEGKRNHKFTSPNLLVAKYLCILV